MSGEDLSSLGVEVRSVAHFAADVAATADAAAEAAELVDYTTRDSALAADIDCFRRELELERVKRQPNAACMQSLRRKIETAEVKRRSLTAAFQARQELAARVAAEASATVSSAGNVPGAQDAKGKDGAVRMAAETQREFDIRTGKITPFHVGEGSAEMFQRRQKTAYALPLARKRPRPALLKDAASAGRARGGIDTRKVAESDDDDDGDSDDDGIHDEEDVGSDWSFDGDGLAEDSDNDDFDSDDEGDMRRRKTSADKAGTELDGKDEDSDGEEVVIDGGLSMPASLFDKLFEYQKTGIKWLAELHNACCGGCLADEMGLGKTVTVVAFLAALQYSGKLPGPVIIVAPATVLKQWARHFQDWWPRFHVRILHQSSAALEVSPRAKRQRKLSTVVLNPNDVICDVTQSKEHAVLVTSYEQVRKHQGKLLDKFEYVVLDEGHRIKNPDADITLTCKMFTTPRRLLLTGTPLQNNLKELWSLFDFVFPGKLGTLVVFQQHFDVPIAIGGYANATKSEVHAAYRCAVTLRDLVSPYMLRRMKADVAIQLPEKQEQVLFCRLSQEQREAYEHFLGSRTVKAVLAGRLNLLYAINVLRQICNHVDIATSSTLWDGRRHCNIVRSYNDDDGSEDDGSNCSRERAVVDGKFGNVARSGKLMVLQTVLEKWKTAGNRVLIFSQTHIVLDILSGFARQSHYEFRRMDGKVAIAKRMELIDEFNSDENIFLFLLSTKVGGLGTNLTGADRVVLFDPDWNPSTDIQARERAWRIGQKKPVVIYRLVTSGTVEEKILHRQVYKSLLSSKVLSDPRQRRFFRRKDMKDLFQLADEKESGTETGDLFAGTVANEIRAAEDIVDVNARKATGDVENDKGDNSATTQMLKDLFNSSGNSNPLQSAMNHDAMMKAGSSGIDADLMQHETERLVTQAVEEVNRSARERRRDGVGVPTWTGRSGLAGIPRSTGKAIVGAAGIGQASGGGLLLQIKQRENGAILRAQSNDASASQLLQDIVSFLLTRNGVSTSDDMVSRFESKVGAGGQSLAMFKATLKRVAVLKKDSGPSGESVWHLRSAYKD